MQNSIYHNVPKRGFTPEEFEARLLRAQKIMHKWELDTIFLTTPPNIRYFSGFDTQFWESPTRPWFLVIPLEGKPIAVIPEIGKNGMALTWVDDIRTWHSPNPIDDGVSLLRSTIEEQTKKFNKVGAELGKEMSIRMPIIEFDKIRENVSSKIIDGSPAIWEMRMVKTASEVKHIEHICKIASDAYNRLPKNLSIGETERDAVRKLRIDIANKGADATPFMPAVSGPGGVPQIICGPSDRILEKGDILFIDTGSTFDGYFCDFDRNFAIGEISNDAAQAYDLLWLATEAGISAAIPGATTEDVWIAMNKIIENASTIENNVGRFGHGLGLQLTEPPSHSFGNKTQILENMVLTIEPGIEYSPGKMMVHEENIVVSKEGPKLLTIRAPREIPIIK